MPIPRARVGRRAFEMGREAHEKETGRRLTAAEAIAWAKTWRGAARHAERYAEAEETRVALAQTEETGT